MFTSIEFDPNKRWISASPVCMFSVMFPSINPVLDILNAFSDKNLIYVLLYYIYSVIFFWLFCNDILKLFS